MIIRRFGILLLVAVFLGACSQTKEEPVSTSGPDTGPETSTVDKTPTPPPTGPGDIMPSQRVIYFDFDKSDVRSGEQSLLDDHAAYLRKHPGTSISLEGHADERGSREYNLALGERRAKAVERYLGVSGVNSDQLSTISYGEERPVDDASNERAWQLNRRVELVYQ